MLNPIKEDIIIPHVGDAFKVVLFLFNGRGSIIHSMTSLSTRREENLGLCSILTSMTTSDCSQTLPRRKMSLMQGKSLKEATINGTSIFSPRLDGRLVPNTWGKSCAILTDYLNSRFLIQRRTTESIQSPEIFIILDCAVVYTIPSVGIHDSKYATKSFKIAILFHIAWIQNDRNGAKTWTLKFHIG
jgi:hypothetical protein